ncbi:MAG: hypothetical protein BWY76_03496 [bacterium ADurb.Bin429]|nr:MAG: hypothetical protein BWY76_03496 [bacterium ADurb.Bin429]
MKWLALGVDAVFGIGAIPQRLYLTGDVVPGVEQTHPGQVKPLCPLRGREVAVVFQALIHGSGVGLRSRAIPCGVPVAVTRQ